MIIRLVRGIFVIRMLSQRVAIVLLSGNLLNLFKAPDADRKNWDGPMMSSLLFGGLPDLRVFAQFLHFWCCVSIRLAPGRVWRKRGREKCFLSPSGIITVAIEDCLFGSFW